MTGYYAETRTPGVSDTGRSYYGQMAYNADRYGATLAHLTVSPEFNPELGFLPRRNFRKEYAYARFSPRPRHMGGVRKLYFEGSLDYISNNENRLESRIPLFAFKADLNNGDQISSSYSPEYQFLANPFPINPRATIPPGGYSFHTETISYTLGPIHRFVRGTVSYSRGAFYDGSRTQIAYNGRVQFFAQFSMEPIISANSVKLPWGAFRTDLLAMRATYTFSPWASLGALIQYTSASKTITSNVRFRWEYVPGSELFVVYNEGRNTVDNRDPLGTVLSPGVLNRTFVVKFTKNFRL